MPNHLRAYFERADNPDTGPIRFVASTEGVKRDGMDLRMDAWDLDNYRKNPVVLWGHDYGGFSSPRPPIGRADVDIEGKNLMANVTFDPDDEFARAIERKYRNGFLNAVSVGWETHGDRDDLSHELLDISGVPVPGDPDALKERQIRGIRAINDILEELTQDDESDEPTGFAVEAQWEGTALRMVRLFLAGADDAREYKRLEREYRRLGRTAPEVPDHLAALDIDTIRGLFVEGEPDLVPELFAAPDPEADYLTQLHAALTGD